MARQVKRSIISAVLGVASACALASPAQGYEPRVPEGYFGVSAPHLMAMAQQNDLAGLQRHSTAIDGAGLDWVRVSIDWRNVEPLLGVGDVHIYNWNATDRLVRALARQHLTLVPSAAGTPFWARDLDASLAGCGGNAAVATVHMTSYGALIGALVDRYGRDGEFWAQNGDLPYQPVQSVELWNEPNWSGFWCPRPEPARFAGLVGAGARAAEAADPLIDVVLGGLVTIKEDERFDDGSIRGMNTASFLQGMLAADPTLAQHLDTVGIHLYDADVDSNLSLVGWLRTRLEAIGLGSAELLVTEFGWRSGPVEGGITEEARARHFTDLAGQLPRTDCGLNGIAAHDWTNLRSDPAALEQWFSIADLATAALTEGGEAYRDMVALYEGRGPTPAPREVIGVCGAPAPDQDGDGVPDELDDYPTDPARSEGSTEPPPPDPTPPPEQPVRPARAASGFYSVGDAFMPMMPDERVPHYDEMARVGVRSVKGWIEWLDIEPARPIEPEARFRWADLDRRILAYAKRHMRISMAAVRTPGWLPADKVGADGAYAEFMTALARRYGVGGTFWGENRHLDASLAPRDYDVWSQANTSAGSWDGTPSAAEYADTYVGTRAALRAVDPAARAIVNLNDYGSAGAADVFLKAMVAARPALRGGIDGVYVMTSTARTPAQFETTVTRIRNALDATGNASARLYMGLGVPLVGTGSLTDAQRADYFSRVASRAPRLDCRVDGLTLVSWTSRQLDGTSPSDWTGVANVVTGASWPSASAYTAAARSAEGYGAQEPERAALHPCMREAPDRDGDGVLDAAESYPLDPTRAVAEATPPPAPGFVQAPAAWSTATKPTISYAAAGATSYHCKLDGEAWRECASQRALPFLADGAHEFTVRAVDALGLLSQSSTHRWTVDTRLPQTSIAQGPSGTVQTENVQFQLASDEPALRFGCRLDAGAWAWCSSTVSYANLADGPHTFRAFAVDRAGNGDTSVAYVAFTVRAVPDQPRITSSEGLTTQTPTFRFDAAYAASFECRFDDVAFAPCSALRAHTPAKPLRDGFHRFYVRGIGGTGKPGPVLTQTLTVDDVKAPDTAIAAGPSGTVPTATVEFQLASDEEGVLFWCKLDASGWSPCGPTVTYSNLANGAHSFHAAAQDAGGNTDPSPARRDFSVAVGPGPAAREFSAAVDAIAPVVEITLLSTARRKAAFRVGAQADSALALLRCRVDDRAWRECENPLRVARLKPGRHVVRAEAIDEWGNRGSSRHAWRARRR